jgi:hypothetical protein
MAAKPLPIPPDVPVINIDEHGNVSQAVEIDNGGQVMFYVTKYGGEGANQCRITISASNIGWHRKTTAGDNTIKVGGGSNT